MYFRVSSSPIHFVDCSQFMITTVKDTVTGYTDSKHCTRVAPSSIINKEMVDSKLRPRCATHDENLLVFVLEQNLVEISTVVLVVLPLEMRAIYEK